MGMQKTLLTSTRRVVLGAPIGLALASQAFAQQPPEAAPEGDGTLLDAWIDAYGRPTAAVMLNGKGPFKFLVDTGATTTVVAARHAAALGLISLGVVSVNGTTGTAELPMASVSQLSAGSVRRRNLRVALIDEARFSAWDGILGADVFIGYRLTFDIVEKAVRLETSPPGQVFSRRLQPNIRLRNGMLPEIKGRIGGVPTRLIIDTGADGSIINPALSRALVQKHPSLTTIPNAIVTGVTGVTIVGEAVVLPRVDIADVSATDCVAIAADAAIFRVWELADEPAMLVGIDLLSRLSAFTIDYRARRFEATPLAQLMSGEPASLG
jgi:predicted aspartyl protease